MSIQFDRTSEGTALVPTDPTQLAEYLRGLSSGEPDVSGDQALAGLDPRARVPVLRMNKPSPGAEEGTWDLRLAGQSLWPSPRKRIFLIVLGTYGQRALFAPGTMESRQASGKMRPVCGVSFADHADLMNNATRGQWYDQDFEAPPRSLVAADGRIQVSCGACPWREFGSAAEWNGGESKAPACGRSRVMMVQFAREKQKLPTTGEDEYSLFDYDPDFQEPFAMTSLSFATNDKSYKDLVAGWAAKASVGGGGKIRLRLPQTVFEATVGRTNDAYKNPVLKTRVVGMVIPPYWRVIDGQVLPAVYEFVAQARARGGEYVSEAEYEPVPEPRPEDARPRPVDIDVPEGPDGQDANDQEPPF